MSSAPRLSRPPSLLERLPAALQRSLAPLRRFVPAGVRFGRRYTEFQRLAHAVESWSADQIAEFQLRHLRQVLIQAGNFCPLYQQRFAEARFQPELVRGPEDLVKCPFTSAEDLVRHGAEMTSTALPARQRLSVPIRGRDGAHVEVARQPGVDRPKEVAFRQARELRAGTPATTRPRLAVFDDGLVSAHGTASVAELDLWEDRLRLSPHHLRAERLGEYREAIERFQPDLLEIEPPLAQTLVDLLAASGQPWSTPLQAVLAGPGPCPKAEQERLERAFGCRVCCWFGGEEHVVLAAQGRESPLLYFWPTYGLVEFGEPETDGFCEIIGTAFHQLAQPLIRFRTGAFARLADPSRDGDLEFPWPAAAAIVRREPLAPPLPS